MLLAVCDHYDIDISTSFEVVFAAQKYRSASPQNLAVALAQVLLKSSLDAGFASSQHKEARLFALHSGEIQYWWLSQRKERLRRASCEENSCYTEIGNNACQHRSYTTFTLLEGKIKRVEEPRVQACSKNIQILFCVLSSTKLLTKNFKKGDADDGCQNFITKISF